jgi:hypothetical protein
MTKLTPIQNRLIKGAVDNPSEGEGVSYQHKVLAQTCMPYRNPGDDVTKWERYNGDVALIIQSMDVYNPRLKKAVVPGLPHGPKARIIMAYINQQAILNNSPVVNVEESMTAFIKRIHSLSEADEKGRKRKTSHVNGREIRAYKEQLSRLASCHFTLAISLSDTHAINKRGNIVEEFDVWFPKDASQRVLWSSSIRLSESYFQTLRSYAIPLDERALGNLSHSAMGLDIYTWLAQRLHRIEPPQPQFITWQNLKEQFGEGYDRMDNFKRIFRKTLEQVLTQYPQARNRITEEKNKGYWLYHAEPPIPYSKPKAVS